MITKLSVALEIKTSIDNNYLQIGDIATITFEFICKHGEKINLSKSSLNHKKINNINNFFSYYYYDSNKKESVSQNVNKKDIEPYKMIDKNYTMNKEVIDNNEIIKIKLYIQYFAVEHIYLKSINFDYSKDNKNLIIKSPPFSIYNKPFQIDENKGNILKDIFAPFNLNGGIFDLIRDYPILATFIILIIISLLAYPFIYRYFKSIKKINYEALKTPWEITLEELDNLNSSGYLISGQIKMYYIQLSIIMRKYLARMLKLFIMESTTDRIPKLLKKKKLSENIIKNIHKLLIICDLVKFAKVLPSKDKIDDNMKIAYDIVYSIKNLQVGNIDLNMKNNMKIENSVDKLKMRDNSK